MKTTLLMCVSLFACAVASASDRVSEIAASTPGASPYQILERFYQEAARSAQLSDFDYADDENSNQKCVLARDGEREAYGTYIARVRHVVPGRPSLGPLFPAIPDRTVEFVVLSGSGRQSMVENARVMYRFISTEFLEKDMVVFFEKGLFQDGPIRLSFRSQDNLIAVKFEKRIGSADAELLYGYCYRE